AFVTAGYHGTILRSAVAPTITNMTFSGNTANFAFATANGLVYRIEYKNTLSAASWTLLHTVSGTGELITTSDPSATEPSRFYRVGIE
ncbi:MAG TPA: hypothetical protein VNM37_08310, partial [Candidatus Dormibacteraeota bacterium]|nr:hypothetical protein [Candidatus Dormibacteraeota bacterium]